VHGGGIADQAQVVHEDRDSEQCEQDASVAAEPSTDETDVWQQQLVGSLTY